MIGTTIPCTRRRPVHAAVLHRNAWVIDPGDRPAATARAHTRDVLRNLDSDLVYDAALIATELVTNAFQHGSGDVTFALTWDDASVVISVQDSATRRPIRTHPADSSQSGRGILLVSELARDYGCRICLGRKEVWARISVASRGAPGRSHG